MKIIVRPIENAWYNKGVETVDADVSDTKEFRQIHRFRCKFCKKYIKKSLIQRTLIGECPHCNKQIFYL